MEQRAANHYMKQRDANHYTKQRVANHYMKQRMLMPTKYNIILSIWRSIWNKVLTNFISYQIKMKHKIINNPNLYPHDFYKIHNLINSFLLI